MRSLLDVRLSRLALAVVVAVSAAATAVILLGGHDRTPAQTAALAALREKPVAVAAAPTRTVTAPATTPTTQAPAAPSGGGSFGGGSSSGGTSSAASSTPSAPAPATTPAATTSTPSASSASTGSTGSAGAGEHTAAASASATLPKVRHVFELVVTAPSERAAFGAHGTLPYLHRLAGRGTLLAGYDSLGDGELADELALVGGQAPNPDTRAGCPRYADFSKSTAANAKGIVSGRGCVYPDTALTIGDQVTASGHVWHAYVADMGTTETCVHPNTDAADDTALPFSEPGYDTRHNPFIYFHSLLDLGDCATDDVDLGHLPKALGSAHATPTFTYLAGSACADADPTMVPAATSTNTSTTTSTTTTTPATAGATSAGATTSTTSTASAAATPSAATAPAGCPSADVAGPSAEDTFLQTWIPRILRSAAYRSGGVLVIAVARSGQSVGHPVRTGALVVSRWATRGHTVTAKADPYALLRLEETALGLKTLAHAATAPALASDVLHR